MRFTFLHAADLHLGSPLTGLGLKDAGVAKRFAAASREAFSDLITQAIAADVAFVIIAGLRLDTSPAGDPSGKRGPRWRPVLRSTQGFVARHPSRF